MGPASSEGLRRRLSAAGSTRGRSLTTVGRGCRIGPGTHPDVGSPLAQPIVDVLDEAPRILGLGIVWPLRAGGRG